MQRKNHLSLIAWFSIFAIALVLSSLFSSTKSTPVTGSTSFQSSIPTEKEGAGSFLQIALSVNTYFDSDLHLIPRRLITANLSKAELRILVGGATAPRSLDVFMADSGTCGDHNVGSMLAEIAFNLASGLPTRADVFAGECE